MKRKRIFIVNQADDSHKYGVGKYINEIIDQASSKSNELELVYVLVGVSDISAVQHDKVENIAYLKIPKPCGYQKNIRSLSYVYSKAVFILLHDFYEFSETDIFHFNSNMQYFLIALIKEHTRAFLIYTVHVSLWKVHYNNNYSKFIEDFTNSEKDSFHINNIRAEMKNCELSNKVICLSESMKKDMLKVYKIPSEKVFEVPNGIKQQKFTDEDFRNIETIKKDVLITEKDVIFLYVGRLTPQKGIAQLLSTFKDIVEKGYENVKLLIVGDGAMKASLVKKYESIKKRIIFAGYLPANSVKLYYKLADALIFPSLNEQSSYVMLEAMSFKVPMIVTNTDIFEMLEHNNSCLKISLNKQKELNPFSFKKQLLTMLKNDKLRNEIAKNAYRLYSQKYSAKVMFDSTYQT
ncbi:glycosyltransferase family 4 protein [Snuella lapsa]|uniref:TIGR04157 family glycosyltransferase n=1 Tax=Snuella lapsa TaxID=870481 RepID=A0ABP6X9T7_9FLAO